jgi:DNA replication protein DnaC
MEITKHQISINFPSDSVKTLSFDRVFPEYSTDEEVYNQTGKPAVEGLFKGVSATLFAYGQTGTGKTHTMGLLKRLSNRSDGIVPRALRHLFGLTKSTSVVTLSFLQIYLENVYDLLNAEETPLLIREDPNGEMFVKNLI